MSKTPPPPPTMPVPPPPPPPPPSRDCLLRGAHGEALCVRQLQQTPCPDEPPPPTATLSGLDPEQQIRARALEIAAKVATAEISFPASNLGEVLALAEVFAGWITTGRTNR